MPIRFLTALISMFLTSTALATTWTVDDDGKADFDNIQAAIDAASDGDEIVVMPGTYPGSGPYEVVNMLGKEIWLHSSEGAGVTIIDGEGKRRGILCDNNETSNTSIEGFTITNGYDTDWFGVTEGGGMFNEYSSPTLTDCTFTNNTGYSGGGMYNKGSNPTLTNCTFTNNTGYGGGGMHNDYGSSPALTNCTFENNTATTGRGGGMYNLGSSPTLDGCTFTGNTAFYHGGGIDNFHTPWDTSNPTLTDTTVCGNTPDQIYGGWTDGGGVCVAYSCDDSNSDGIPDNCTNPGGNIILVPEDYSSIQDAINVAVHGDEIIIGPGTYTGFGYWVVNPMGKRLLIHSSDGPKVTIIDGEGVRRGIQCTGDETSETIFEGLTITNCFAEDNYGSADYGGGMLNYESSPTLENCTFTNNTCYAAGGMYNHSNSSPTVTDCIFTNNTTSSSGGGMYNNLNSSPTVTDCTFTNNTAGGSGGGMKNSGSTTSPTLENCTFTNNTANNDGGGMYNTGSGNPTLTNCSFTGNTAADYGGGMNNRTNYPTLTGCTFKNNTAHYGGGMYNIDGGATLYSCTFKNNTSSSSGGGMYNNSSSPTLYGCTFRGNTAALYYGGGMYNNSPWSDPTLTATTVCGNTPDQIYGDWTDNSDNTISDKCPPALWTVDDDGKADFDNIQAAVDAAYDGDEIVVMPGTYTSTQDGHVVNMLGKAVILRSSDPSDPDVVAATIIDGENTRRGLACYNYETSKTIISGFTITNGYSVEFDYNGNGEIDYFEDAGGGMYNDYSSPTVTDCTFTGNTSNSGGGMYNSESNPTLTGCTFTDNTANGGGGMYNGGSNPTLTGCTFTNNTADYGAGMYNLYSSPMLDACAFTNNTAFYDGGGMHNYYCSPTLTDCTFESNTAADGGGGMNNFFNSSPTLTDCTFENNDATSNGGGIRNDYSNPTLTDCTFTSNSSQNGGGMYNISSNPTFTGCIFDGNAATYFMQDDTGRGGGLYNLDSSPVLTNCEITNNLAGQWGGGMCNDGSNPDLDGCVISGNSAYFHGGGMYNAVSVAWMSNSSFCLNDPDHIYGAWVDLDGNTFDIDCDDDPPFCMADVNEDYNVDVLDLLYVIAVWGTDNQAGDINEDGWVEVGDLLEVISSWGACP